MGRFCIVLQQLEVTELSRDLGQSRDYGGDSSEVQDQLKGVQQLQATS